MAINWIVIGSYKSSIAMVGPKHELEPEHMLQSLNMVHLHYAPSLKAHQLQKLDSYFQQYGPWMIFKSPYIFHVHGSWSVCQVTLHYLAYESYAIVPR
jgi:hypothetical protein